MKNIDEYDEEFYHIVKDIIELNEFQNTKNLKHHGNGLYEHSLRTAYLAYKIAKKCGADEVCAARAGMLHDFFSFDWRSDEAKERKKNYRGFQKIKNMHGFMHPFEAYDNASKYFTLSDRERDAIIKHMFPLVPLIPLYRESWIVTFSDKIIATSEMWSEAINMVKFMYRKRKHLKI